MNLSAREAHVVCPANQWRIQSIRGKMRLQWIHRAALRKPVPVPDDTCNIQKEKKIKARERDLKRLCDVASQRKAILPNCPDVAWALLERVSLRRLTYNRSDARASYTT